ncbi:MAG TPA: inorganic phosphate transporter [Thermodesulfobacteriota bacterium]|nr:inorganic phosphate transporter [Thermodesulfobacteriota bacterium]
MSDSFFLIALVVIVALFFDFTNGWNDSANAIATVVSTRVLSPLQAVLFAAVLNFVGAYLSTKVAKTIGGDITDPTSISQTVVLAGMIAAAGWVALMTRFGLPISASHSLIGGIIGAVVAAKGFAALEMEGVAKILIALIFSPILGLIIGFLFMLILIWTFHRFSRSRINRLFGRLQIVSAGFMAISHGTNDAQKVMGVITLALVSGGFLDTLEVPLWVITACAAVIALGTAIGGWKVIKTLGVNLLKLQPIHGFAAETSASIVILGAGFFGLPVSTTHVITSTIMGVGSTRRLTAVRWGIAKDIVMAWIFTLPVCAIVAGVIFWLIDAIIG